MHPPVTPPGPPPAAQPAMMAAPPPPMAPPGGMPWTVPRLQAVGGLGTAALALAGVVLLFSIASAVAAFPAARSFRDTVESGGSVLDTFTAYDLIGIPFFLCEVAAWIVTAIWLGRVRGNVAVLRPGFRFRRSVAWDWLGWFIPIVSFWFPWQIVGDASKGSSRSLTPHRWLGLWWATWLVGLLVSTAGDQIALGQNATSSSIGMLPIFATVSAIAWIVAYALWVQIVRSIVRDQGAATPPVGAATS